MGVAKGSVQVRDVMGGGGGGVGGGGGGLEHCMVLVCFGSLIYCT